jgi:hypothetical protein
MMLFPIWEKIRLSPSLSLADMRTMIDLLQSVKKNIDNNLFLPVKSVRKLNQAYSTSFLFGQYVADIFSAL